MRRAVVCVLVVLSTALASCSSGGSDTDAPRRGGTLRVATVGVTTLDPAMADEPSAAAIAGMLFSPLVSLDPASHEPRPGLAARWHVNEAQTEFTFTLRPGLEFSNGKAVTATAVKATFDRVAAKATGSPLAPLLEPIAGYAAAHDQGTAAGLSGVVVKSPRVLEVHLAEAFAAMPSVFSYPGLGIVDPSSVAGLATQPVGSGPFHWKGRAGTTIELARTRGDDSARLAAIDLVPYPTVDDARDAFAEHRVDVFRLARDDASKAGGGGVLHHAPYLAVGFYAIDVANPKFADARFRQAIVQAIDAASLVDDAYPGGIVSSGLVPVGVPNGGTDQCRGTCDYDPKAAKKLVAAAFPNGGVPTVNIDYDDSPAQKQLADDVVTQLGAVGITAQLRPHPEADYANFLANGAPEVFRFGLVGDYPSEDPFLAPWFLSGAAENVTRLASPEVDAAVKKARETENPTKRSRAYDDAARGVLAQFAVAPVVQFETRLVSTASVRDLTIDPFGGFDAALVWKAPAGGS